MSGSLTLTVVSEHLLQALTCKKYTALYSAEGQIHFLGDLTVLIARHVHRERHTIKELMAAVISWVA